MVARAGADGPDTGLQQDVREYRLEHGSSKFDRDDKQDDLNSRTSHHGYQEAASATFKSNMQLALATGDVRRAHNSEPMEFDEDIEQREQEDEEELAERLGDPVHGFRVVDQTEVSKEIRKENEFSAYNTPDLNEAAGMYEGGLHRISWAQQKRAPNPLRNREDGLVPNDFARMAWQENDRIRLDMDKMYAGSGLDKYNQSSRKELPVNY